MSVRFGLLALLAESPTHGYQLKTDFERRRGGSWLLNIGQVYTTLQRLERDGLVQELEGASADDRRDFRITTAGRQQLEDWFTTPVVPEGPARDELTIKILLAVAAGDIDVTDLLQRQRRASIEQLQAYTRPVHRRAASRPALGGDLRETRT